MSSFTLVPVASVVAILVGLAGRRWRQLRLVLAGIGPLYAAAVFIYSLVEGSTSICTGTGGTFRCTEVTYASTWGLGGSVAVGASMVLTLGPLLSVWLRNRIPSVVASIALPIVLVFTVSPASWLPAWAAVLAAAVAGPPSGDRTTATAPKV